MYDIEKIKADAYDRLVRAVNSDISFSLVIAQIDHIIMETSIKINDCQMAERAFRNGPTHAKKDV